MGRLRLLSWLARIVLALQMLWLPQAAMAAAYATGGDGHYKNEILWLTWGGGVNGVHNQPLVNGSMSVANLPVADGQNLVVSCKLENPKAFSGTSNALKSYKPGDYGMDRLNYLYNIGGSANNKLITGIVNDVQGAGINFDVTCSAKIGNIDVDLQGFVIADAESMSAGEYIQSEALGEWYVLDRYRSTGAKGTYDVVKSSTSSKKSQIKISASEDNQGNNVVNFLKFDPPLSSTQTMSFSIKGQGKTAIAIGVVVPYADFGDAPSTYGDAMHIIDDLQLSQDGIGPAGSANVAGANSDGFTLAKLQSPQDNFLGSLGPDTEPGSLYSDLADKDDDLSGDEENAWPKELKKFNILQAGTLLSVDIKCKGTGFVSGWIDFNINKVFDSTEQSKVASCVNANANLTWNIPSTFKSSDVDKNTYVRLRYATRLDEVSRPLGIAQDGEVEDHLITIVAPKLQIIKKNNAGSNGWTIGQSGATYTLTVSNQGDVPTGPALNPSLWKPVKVLDQLPVGITPAWDPAKPINGWTCSYVGQLATCETPNHLAAKGQANSVSEIVLPVNVVSAGSQSKLVNYASVGGGMDPTNGGEPYPPASCTKANYCANSEVTIKTPAIAVSKIAMPADQSKVQVGDFITYTLQVKVSDSATLSPVVLTDTLGAGLEYAGISANAAGFVEGGSASTRTFTLGKGAVPGTYSVSYRAKVLANAVSKV